MTKIIIDIKSANENTISETCEKYGVSRMTLNKWSKKAPDVVVGVFKAIEENPKSNVLKILKGWQKAPFVICFIRDFMIENNCKFTDIVKKNIE